MSGPPIVSIGMPVFNEGRYLRPAIESLLNQDFRNIEMVITDNASTDDTADICREYANRDPRVKYVQNETNIGSFENFNRAFNLSRGKYFMWAGGHDLWRPTFIIRCLEILERDSSVVLCYPQIICMDEDDRPMDAEPSRLDTRAMGVSSRLNLVIWGLNRCDLIYGLIRSDALRRTRLFRAALSPDNIIVAELSLMGALAYLPEPLFQIRCFKKNESYADAFRRLAGHHMGKHGRVFILPSWRYFWEHIVAVIRAPLPWGRKPVLLSSVVFGLLARRSKHMFHDIWNAWRLFVADR